ncbi:MAG: STAS domain-containing protein [Spongiibacteraceae bacterium]
MTIIAKPSTDGSELTIEVEGRFDFSAHLEFRKAYEKPGPKPKKFVIDMSRTSYLDSSALGMLLLLRDFAGGDSARINISHCSPEVKNILTVSNFDQLFTLD